MLHTSMLFPSALMGESEGLIRYVSFSCQICCGSGMRKLFRNPSSSFVALHFLLLLFLLPTTIGDLNSDRQALLDFSAAVPHARKLNWDPTSPICTSWVGIKCNSNSTRVHALRLPAVGLYGSIPANTLGKLDALWFLSLRSNFLNGNLPSDILSIPSLRIANLQYNNFSGKIPPLSINLNLLDLSFNSFVGIIPTTVQNLTGLTGLFLQNNFLTGAVPNLNLPRLRHLNLSYNHLNGSIPSSLQKFPTSSFDGNSLLCGRPLNQCSVVTPPSSPAHSPSPSTVHGKPNNSNKKLSRAAIIAIAVGGFVALIFLLVLVLVLCCYRKKDGEGSSVMKGKAIAGGRSEKPKQDFGSGVQEAEKNKLVFFEGSSFNFDLEDLLRASAEVLGKGSYGTAYKAILEEGTTVVVKRLKEVVVGKKEFEQQMEIVGRIGQHPHVVPLRSYYYSKDEKLLVYDYISTGSLSVLLHANRDTSPLNWDCRFKISLGTAKGIAHLHAVGGGKFTHGNIKSSNVLLTQELQACVSDFGLTPLMNIPAIPSRSAGYRAPEAIETRKTTQKSDVYSFGVLVLEMLTGKAPSQSPGHEDVADLPRWVQSVVREEWTAEVFDVELMKYPGVEDELVQMLQIALACVSKVPDSRPTMEEVVRTIEDVRPSDFENQQSSEDKSHTPTP